MNHKEEREIALNDVTSELGEAYANWKTWEAAKDEHKREFFALADADVADRGLAIKMIEMPATTEGQARERVERHYPTWLIDELRASRIGEPVYEAVLRENPAYKPYTFTHEGMTYGRQISKGPVMLDDEWLAEDEPALYTQVTFELPWGDIIPLPVDQIPEDLVGRLTKYIYMGKPRASLSAPRPVKEES